MPTPLYNKWTKLPPDFLARVEKKYGKLTEATPWELPQDEFTRYATRDAAVTMGVYQKLQPISSAMGLDQVMQIDHDIIPMVAAMMGNGLLVDQPHFELLDELFGQMMDDLHKEITHLMDLPNEFNVGSDDQVAELLFSNLHLPYLYMTDSGKRPSVDQETLENLKYLHPVAGKVLDWREIETLKTTFVLPLLGRARSSPDGRIYPNILLTRQPTGRLTTKNPNLLAIPTATPLGRLIREGFIPTPGFAFLSVDYSQLEARILAHLSKDEKLCKIFNTGKDPFRLMAADWYGCKPEDISDEIRYVTKHNFYGIQNGLTPSGLSVRLIGAGLKQWNVQKVEEFMKGFFEAFPGIANAISMWQAEARATGMVRDMWGRYRYIPQVRSTKKNVREAGLRAAQNFNMPGGASGIMKLAMKSVWDFIKEENTIKSNLQIHDELLNETRVEETEGWGKKLCQIMEGVVKLRVPLKAKYAFSPLSWGAIDK